MMPAAWLTDRIGLAIEYAGGPHGPVDRRPADDLTEGITALEAIAVLSPASIPPEVWAITGMDAVIIGAVDDTA